METTIGRSAKATNEIGKNNSQKNFENPLTNSISCDIMLVQQTKGVADMAKSAKVLNEEIKSKFLASVTEFLNNAGEEVLRVGSNEIALPVLDEDSNEKWLVLTFKVPTGSRDGDAYDGYSMAEDWSIKCKTKEETAKKKAEEKAKKIARDEKARAKKKEEA